MAQPFIPDSISQIERIMCFTTSLWKWNELRVPSWDLDSISIQLLFPLHALNSREKESQSEISKLARQKVSGSSLSAFLPFPLKFVQFQGLFSTSGYSVQYSSDWEFKYAILPIDRHSSQTTIISISRKDKIKEVFFLEGNGASKWSHERLSGCLTDCPPIHRAHPKLVCFMWGQTVVLWRVCGPIKLTEHIFVHAAVVPLRSSLFY